MIDGYIVFMLCALFLWVASTPKDRAALGILLNASIASFFLVGLTHQIDGSWKLVFPATLEMLTILAMLKWARGRTGYLQCGLLVVAWLTHVLCYTDIRLRTDIVYSRYETILAWVSAGQLATCYDTMRFNLNRAYAAATSGWADSVFGVPDSSHSAALSVVLADKEVSSHEGNRTANHKPALASK